MKATITRECVNIARKHVKDHPERYFLHFSFIVQANQIVEWAMNRTHTPPQYMGYYDYSKLHSESLAYKRAKGLLRKDESFEIVNIRLDRKGNFRNSLPCLCCMRWLKELGCRHILFSTNAGLMRLT